MALVTRTRRPDRAPVSRTPLSPEQPRVFAAAASWLSALPVLTGSHGQLRELRPSDAPALLALSARQVARFISPPPATVAGFERFIEWTRRQRESGECLCFAVVPRGGNDAVGIIQVRRLNGSFGTAEWGFAIAEAFWGTGLFHETAQLVLTFCFDVVGVHRVEARAATLNGRGNAALRKLGASCEGLLKCGFLRDGRYFDQFLWSISRDHR